MRWMPFLEGVGCVLDIFGVMDGPAEPLTPEEAQRAGEAALRSDWEAVGRDMAAVLPRPTPRRWRRVKENPRSTEERAQQFAESVAGDISEVFPDEERRAVLVDESGWIPIGDRPVPLSERTRPCGPLSDPQERVLVSWTDYMVGLSPVEEGR